MHTESSNDAFETFTTKEFVEVGMSKYVLLAQKCCSVLENCPGCHSFVSRNIWNCRHLSSKRKNCRTRWQRWKITWRFLVPKIPFWSMVAMGSCKHEWKPQCQHPGLLTRICLKPMKQLPRLQRYIFEFQISASQFVSPHLLRCCSTSIHPLRR